MNTRKGLGKGLGMGYKNIVQRDPYIHSLSAKGVKTKAVSSTNKFEDWIKKQGGEIKQLKPSTFNNRNIIPEDTLNWISKERYGLNYTNLTDSQKEEVQFIYWLAELKKSKMDAKSINPKSYFRKELKKEHIKPFNLPVQTAILVPSTKEGNKKISRREFEERILNTRKELSKLFGGFTSVTATGGYEDIDTGDIIKERVNLVVAYAETKKFKKKTDEFIEYVEDKKKEWGQQSMGVIVENDLYYI